jgi:hypothetical protein
MEDSLKSFQNERMQDLQSTVQKDTPSSLSDAPTLDEQRPLMQWPARDDLTSSATERNGSPNFSRIEERTGCETPSIRQGPTPAVTWELGRSSEERDGIQASYKQHSTAGLDDITPLETSNIFQGPTPAATFDLGCSGAEGEGIQATNEGPNSTRQDELVS